MGIITFYTYPGSCDHLLHGYGISVSHIRISRLRKGQI